MLYSIIDDDERFAACVAAVKKSYWPEARLIEEGAVHLPGWVDPPDDAEIVRQTDVRKQETVAAVAAQPHYEIVNTGQRLFVPYLQHYHRLFSVRKWNIPYRDPKLHVENLFRLHQPTTKPRRDDYAQNWSANAGNYNHFVNVVAATARFIQHFSDPENVGCLFGEHTKVFVGSEKIFGTDRPFEMLAYKPAKRLRTFKLMLAAYYHDIGKAVVDHRHAMEGNLLLSSHTSRAWIALNTIAETHRIPGCRFDRDDLVNVADLVLFHDIFGTLATGETGYVRLCDVIASATRAGLRHDSEQNHAAWSWRVLFDLWVLNCADIMVSIDKKFAPQDDLLDAKRSAERIQAFLYGRGAGGDCSRAKHGQLVHDLILAYKLLRQQTVRRHSSGSVEIQNAARDASRAHGVERLRRLIVNTIPASIEAKRGEEECVPRIFRLLRAEVMALSEESQASTITRSLQSIGSIDEFVERLASVGQLDYALGFFRPIAEVASRAVAAELAQQLDVPVEETVDLSRYGVRANGGATGKWRTGWIRDSADDPTDGNAKLFLTMQARHFFENYVAVVTKLIGHVLFRERTGDRVFNVEFSDAKERLSQGGEERIRELADFEGPNRHRQAIHSILKSVFLY